MSNTINIGDRVRLLHDDAEGIVRKFLKDGTVEVEIEDGFGIPVLPMDLVKVSTQETDYFGTPKPQKKTNKPSKTKNSSISKIISESGFYIAFDPINDQLLSVKLINNTDLDMLITFGEFQDSGRHYGLAGTLLKQRSVEKVHEVSLAKFEKWGAFLVQALFFKRGYGQPKKPLARKLKFNASGFFKSKHTAPILEREVYLYQIDGQHVPPPSKPIIEEKKVSKNKPQKLDTTQLRESMLMGKSSEKQTTAPISKDAHNIREVDLHIENILPPNHITPKEEYLNKQLDFFEKELEKANMQSISEIVFIHGVGNGILRNEIHKHLGKSTVIEYFKDARKEKFGYGATYVKMK